MSVGDINAWLVGHQLVVTLVVTPLLSILVGGTAAWYSGRKAIAFAHTERMHQSALEIARYRQAWIDALRDDIAEFGGITSIGYAASPPVDKVERVSVLAQRIRMRMNRSDPDYVELTTSLTGMLEHFMAKGDRQHPSGKPIVPLSQDILKREWERLKADLRESDQ